MTRRATEAGWPLAVQGFDHLRLVGRLPHSEGEAADRRRALLRELAHAELAWRADGSGTVALGLLQLGALAELLGASRDEVVASVTDLLTLGRLAPRRTVRHPLGVLVVTRAAVVGLDRAVRPRRPERPPLPRAVRERVWARSGGRCWYCGVACNPFGGFCVDHLRPLAAGGGGALANLVPCCPPCNGAKGGRTVEVWRKRIVRELDGAPAFTDEQWAFVEAGGYQRGIEAYHVFWFELEASQAHIRDPGN